MGTNSSKASNDSNTILQSPNKEEGFSDPRSPTPEIIRTPLQTNTQGGKKNITKNADLRNALENSNEEKGPILANPILSAVIKNHLQYYDPRSPTQEFDRTPIVLPNKLENEDDNCGTPHLKETPVDDLDDSICQQYQLNSDMVPKKLCDGFFDMTLDETLKEQEEPLGSSTESHAAIENNISATSDNNPPATLLETNFDYIEEAKNESNDNTQDASTKSLYSFEILDNDPRSPSFGIERTPIVVTKSDNIDNYNVERIADDVLIKALQSTNKGLRHTLSHDKNKDELLIYEDEVYDPVNLTPRKSVPEANNGSRTPLSCMKNKSDCQHVRSKSANMFDSKTKNVQPSKRISHIPRLKSLAKATHNNILTSNNGISASKTSVISGCENTPPNSHRDIWDKDNSIVL